MLMAVKGVNIGVESLHHGAGCGCLPLQATSWRKPYLRTTCDGKTGTRAQNLTIRFLTIGSIVLLSLWSSLATSTLVHPMRLGRAWWSDNRTPKQATFHKLLAGNHPCWQNEAAKRPSHNLSPKHSTRMCALIKYHQNIVVRPK